MGFFSLDATIHLAPNWMLRTENCSGVKLGFPKITFVQLR